MTKNITAVNTNLSFATLYTAVNTVIQVLANEIVTANSAAGGGATTTGNGFVVGIFGANTIVAPLLVGGNVISVNTVYLGANLNVNSNIITSGIITINATALTVGANVTANASTLALGNSTVNSSHTATSLFLGNTTSNAVINATGFYYNSIPLGLLYQVNTTLTGTSTQNVDFFLSSQYRASEYTLTVVDNVANNSEVTQVLMLQTGGNAYHTEYGTVLANSAMGVFGVGVNTTAAYLQFTPISANVTIKGIRQSVPV